jgi:hypothetical protein
MDKLLPQLLIMLSSDRYVQKWVKLAIMMELTKRNTPDDDCFVIVNILLVARAEIGSEI